MMSLVLAIWKRGRLSNLKIRHQDTDLNPIKLSLGNLDSDDKASFDGSIPTSVRMPTRAARRTSTVVSVREHLTDFGPNVG